MEVRTPLAMHLFAPQIPLLCYCQDVLGDATKGELLKGILLDTLCLKRRVPRLHRIRCVDLEEDGRVLAEAVCSKRKNRNKTITDI